MDVTGCSNLTEKSLLEINQHCYDSLLELKISSNIKVEFEEEYREVINNSILPMGISSTSGNDFDSPAEQDASAKEDSMRYTKVFLKFIIVSYLIRDAL